MKYKVDIHVHSNASSHAYSTLEELVAAAKRKDLAAFALTNHGPSMPDSPHAYHFGNMKVLPDFIDGVRVFRGIEANIINEDGEIDFPPVYDDYLEIILASFHNQTPYGEGDDVTKNTNAVVNCIKKGYVDILTHMGNPQFKIEYKPVVEVASKYKVAIELNNSSFIKSRPGSINNCKTLMVLCKEYNCPIALGSDTHFSSNIGNLSSAAEIIKELNIPDSLIINTTIDKLEEFLKGRRANR